MTGFLATLFFIACPTEQPVRVTVVIVLGTTQDIGVDPKLVELAKEVQKREPKLIGFQLVAAEAKSIVVGDSYTFALVDKQELKVRVEKPKDANGRISLTMDGPGVEKLSYGCACDKFFPIVTSHQTKKGEVLILAVMAKPCTAGKQKISWVPWRD
jgi:hypothetical protein